MFRRSAAQFVPAEFPRRELPIYGHFIRKSHLKPMGGTRQITSPEVIGKCPGGAQKVIIGVQSFMREQKETPAAHIV